MSLTKNKPIDMFVKIFVASLLVHLSLLFLMQVCSAALILFASFLIKSKTISSVYQLSACRNYNFVENFKEQSETSVLLFCFVEKAMFMHLE